MHYTTMGEATTDRTKVGLIFAKDKPKVVLNGGALINGSLHIPAGEANHRVDAEMTINRDLMLYSLTPHTHVRGKRWSLRSDLSRRPQAKRCSRCRTTTSSGSTNTCSASR